MLGLSSGRVMGALLGENGVQIGRNDLCKRTNSRFVHVGVTYPQRALVSKLGEVEYTLDGWRPGGKGVPGRGGMGGVSLVSFNSLLTCSTCI